MNDKCVEHSIQIARLTEKVESISFDIKEIKDGNQELLSYMVKSQDARHTSSMKVYQKVLLWVVSILGSGLLAVLGVKELIIPYVM